MDKTALRKQLTKNRDAISETIQKEAPEQCVGHLRKWDIYQKTEVIYIFVSFRSELNTIRMIPELLKDGKRVAVPKVVGKEMIFREIKSLDDCEPGLWGILEPKDHLPVMTARGMILVPGLGFDKEGYRIGYGGGFYDRYLEKYPELIPVGLGYEEQYMEQIPRESYDKVVKYLLTPAKLRKIGDL